MNILLDNKRNKNRYIRESNLQDKHAVREFADECKVDGLPLMDYKEFSVLLNEQGMNPNEELYQVYVDAYNNEEDTDYIGVVRKKFEKMSSNEIIDLLGIPNSSNIDSDSPMFILPNGSIISVAQAGKLIGQELSDNIHSDMVYVILSAIANKYNYDWDMDDRWYEDNKLAYLTYELGWARLNCGETWAEKRFYCVLPNHMTSAQYRSLENWLEWGADTGKNEVLVYVGRDEVNQTYYFKETFPEDIIKKIKRYYSSGRLYENKNLSESLHKLGHNCFITDSSYDIKNLINNKPKLYRILYDSNIDMYMIGDGNQIIHWDMIKEAYKQGYYYNMEEFIEELGGALDNYVDTGIYGLYDDDYEIDPYLIYIVYCPDDSFTLGEDGYGFEYPLENGTIFTRDDNFADCSLYYRLQHKKKPNAMVDENGNELKENMDLPNDVEMFYDRHLKLWTIYLKDEEGNQISNTEYAPNRKEALYIANNKGLFNMRESLNTPNTMNEEFVNELVPGELYHFVHNNKILYGTFKRKTPAWLVFDIEGKEVMAKPWTSVATTTEELEELIGLVDKMEKDTKIPSQVPNRFTRVPNQHNKPMGESNELEQRAKKHKKKSKGMGWHMAVNAGDVEKGIEVFNNSTSCNISSGEGCGAMGEAIEKNTYSYNGPIYYRGRKIATTSDLVTKASSINLAIRNILFQAAHRDRDELRYYDIVDDMVKLVPNDKTPAPKRRERCQVCGYELNDIGDCPVCDYGEDDLLESLSALEALWELSNLD